MHPRRQATHICTRVALLTHKEDKHTALRRGAIGACEEVVQLNTELRHTASNGLTSHMMQYNIIYRILEYALEITNSKACFKRERFYYMLYEFPVFSFPGVSVASK